MLVFSSLLLEGFFLTSFHLVFKFLGVPFHSFFKPFVITSHLLNESFGICFHPLVEFLGIDFHPIFKFLGVPMNRLFKISLTPTTFQSSFGGVNSIDSQIFSSMLLFLHFPLSSLGVHCIKALNFYRVTSLRSEFKNSEPLNI